MTFTVLKSQVPPDFADQVESHRQALLAHRFTLERPVPTPPNHWVEQCIRREQYPIKDKKPDNFVSDFQIINDDPPPPTLAQKKQKLFESVTTAEHAAVAAVCPPGKWRLYGLQRTEIMNKKPVDVSSDEKAFIIEDDARRKRVGAIQRKAAEQLAEIEDLTDETVDRWIFRELT